MSIQPFLPQTPLAPSDPPATVAPTRIRATGGDRQGTPWRIVEAARQAHEHGARLFLTSELDLSGYAPQDLLL